MAGATEKCGYEFNCRPFGGHHLGIYVHQGMCHRGPKTGGFPSGATATLPPWSSCSVTQRRGDVMLLGPAAAMEDKVEGLGGAKLNTIGVLLGQIDGFLW